MVAELFIIDLSRTLIAGIMYAEIRRRSTIVNRLAFSITNQRLCTAMFFSSINMQYFV